ncbi:MAG: adenine deaminase [Dehalococcoidia bacterium]
MNRQRLIEVARGDAPGDLLFTNGRVLNTLTAEIEQTDVVVAEGHVAGLGADYQARERVDLRGRYLLPGLIDAHTHLESSMLWVGQYAQAVVPRGTTAIVTDLHEIANVCGVSGVEATVRAAASLPLELHLMVPSCVPATDLETSGASLGPSQIRRLSRLPQALGLGEMMNFPGVVSGQKDMLRRIEAAGEGVLDGHAPGLRERPLNAYLAAGMRSDHETTSFEEGREKLRRGMYLMIREGTTEKNLQDLLPLVTDLTYPRCMFVVDDRSCHDLLHDGDMDAVLRKAVRLGLDPVRAIQLATINPATYFGLRSLGAVAPGYAAHLMICDDLRDLRARQVYFAGRLVAEDGRALFPAETPISDELLHTFRLGPLSPESFALPAHGPTYPVIEVVPGQIVTARSIEPVLVRDGQVLPDPARDILKIAVVERHRATGNVGVALVRGLGLKRGAVASSVAHDSHNIVAASADPSDRDLYAAVSEVARLEGGLAVAADGGVLASLALPIAGLMSPEPPEEVSAALRRIEDAAASLGAGLPSPFAVLSFLALPVIPSLKLTDRGLVDVEKGAFFDFRVLAQA